MHLGHAAVRNFSVFHFMFFHEALGISVPIISLNQILAVSACGFLILLHGMGVACVGCMVRGGLREGLLLTLNSSCDLFGLPFGRECFRALEKTFFSVYFLPSIFTEIFFIYIYKGIYYIRVLIILKTLSWLVLGLYL